MPRPSEFKSRLRELPEIADSFRWNLEVISGPDGWPENDDLNLRCVSATMPSRTMAGQIDVQIKGFHIMRPGPMDETHSINLIFVETVDNMISRWLKEWRDAVWDPDTGLRQDADDYTAEIKLVRLNHKDTPIWEFVLKGCYLQEFDPGGDLSGDAGQGIQPNITLYYDTYEDNPLESSAA